MYEEKQSITRLSTEVSLKAPIMTDLHCWFFTCWLIFHLSVCKCSDIIVESFDGENVTLPCKYDSQYHRKCHICWMKGDIPKMGCGNEIMRSDGDRVVRRMSDRYQMEGKIPHGDVSLTISNVQKTDSGKYGCRIHIPGLFNDHLYYVHLFVKDYMDTTQETSSVLSSSASSDSSSVPLNTTHTNRTEPHESSVDYHESSAVAHTERVNAFAVIVPVVLILLLLTAISVFMIWKQKRKSRATAETSPAIPQTAIITARETITAQNSVIYSNPGSSVALHNREMAVENIYHIQTDSEYERWN